MAKKVKMTERQLKKRLTEIFDDNDNYRSSYTGTPMIMSEIAMLKIMKLIKEYSGK